jgi:hypothetical protein
MRKFGLIVGALAIVGVAGLFVISALVRAQQVKPDGRIPEMGGRYDSEPLRELLSYYPAGMIKEPGRLPRRINEWNGGPPDKPYDKPSEPRYTGPSPPFESLAMFGGGSRMLRNGAAVHPGNLVSYWTWQNEPIDSRENGITTDGVLVVEPLRSRPRLINPDAVVLEVKKRMFGYLEAARRDTASFRDAHTRCLAQVPEYALLNDVLKAGTDPKVK